MVREHSMNDIAQTSNKRRIRLWLALAAIAVLVLGLVVPPLIGVNRYKGRITQLMAQSLGRPVRLASVEVRLLPWPGFVLTDLNVAEDPAYGAEPVLHANTVRASLRLLSLWRGQLKIDKISVDEASLNLVRVAPGKWNLDPIFRTAAAQSGAAANAAGGGPRSAFRLPTLVATNSRIDFKNGTEKLPFSIVNADLSFWQASPGEWRIQLRGQPARTDVSLYQEETGVVRMEASVHSAAALSQMPMHLYLSWREAQLGQLARLVTGSDSGWRGDLTGELHVDGTADAARVAMRLRAAGVHRAEFAPATPLDFDANCGFLYHYNLRSFEDLDCNSPLGDGRMRLTGEKPGLDTPARFAVELDRVPVAAGLAALRTLRSGFASDLDAGGTVSGKLVYDAASARAMPPAKPAKSRHASKSGALQPNPLAGALTVEDFALTGGGLSKPVQAARIVFAPSPSVTESPEALSGTMAVPVGGDAPLIFEMRFSLTGYRVGVHGPAAIARARDLANAAGIPEAQFLREIAGEPLTLDLTAAGPWLPPAEDVARVAQNGEASLISAQDLPAPALDSGIAAIPVDDLLTGTVTLRNANWKADYLANHVQIAEATLHLNGTDMRWDPVVFTYGPLKGTATLSRPLACNETLPEPQVCPAQLQMQFAGLDAGLLESALLGAQQKATLLSDLIDRLHPSSSPPWPALDATIKADALVLGPVTLHAVTAAARVRFGGAEISSFDAGLFGGSVHMSGSLIKPANDQDKPAYTFEGNFQKVNVAPLGALLGLRWTGTSLSGNGKVELAGYTAKDFARSAHGSLHFECRRGAITEPSQSTKQAVPAALGRFDQWSADATIANGGITLGQNSVTASGHTEPVEATVRFGEPPSVRFMPSAQAAKIQ